MWRLRRPRHARARLGVGVLVALGGTAGASAALLPLRGHLSPATAGLVLVVPVVAAAVAGGFVAGLVAVAAGFLAYDFLFIRPFGTLAVGAAQDWVVLGVYAVVVLLVARTVAGLDRARDQAAHREETTRRLFEFSELLLLDRTPPELLQLAVDDLHRELRLHSVAAFLPGPAGMELAAAAGAPLPAGVVAQLIDRPGTPRDPVPVASGQDWRAVPLSTLHGPVGLLVVVEGPGQRHDDRLLTTLANQASLAVERARLRDQATRAEVLEQIDRGRSALLRTVSHDLRTPLATIKAAASDLGQAGLVIADDDRAELLGTIASETDRLTRLVTNLLDMARIESGALRPARQPTDLGEIVDEVLWHPWPDLAPGRLTAALDPDLPLLDVDPVLVGQILVNLIDNALRHAPPDRPIEIAARARPPWVELRVIDHGPGIPAAQWSQVFQPFWRAQAPAVTVGHGTGLGLAICRAFIDAHGGRIAVEETPGGGATMVLHLPVTAPLPAVP